MRKRHAIRLISLTMSTYTRRPKVLFLTCGPSQRGSLEQYIGSKFTKQAEHFGYISAHNKPEIMELISKDRKGQLIFIPHLPSDRLGAHQLAQRINSRNAKAVVVAWTCHPPEKMELTTLAGVIMRRRKKKNGGSTMYEEIAEVISKFLSLPKRWVVVKAIRELHERQLTKLQEV